MGLLVITTLLIADKHTCNTQWILENGKRYAPNESIKTVNVELLGFADSIHLMTNNISSYYDYSNFLDIDGRLGISFKHKEKYLDIFSDGHLVIWNNNKAILKAKCPTLRLDIGKMFQNQKNKE